MKSDAETKHSGEVYTKFSDSASAHGLHAIQSQTVLTIDYLVFSHFFSDSNSLNVDVFWFTSLRSDSKLNIFGSQ